MRGERRPTPLCSAMALDMGGGLHVCVNIPGLNTAASQALFCPSRVGRSGSYPCSYVPLFDLLNVAASYQHFTQGTMAAHEARRQAVLTEEVPDPRELPGPPEPPGPREPVGS